MSETILLQRFGTAGKSNYSFDERARERARERKRDRETDRERQTETDRQRETDRERQLSPDPARATLQMALNPSGNKINPNNNNNNTTLYSK